VFALIGGGALIARTMKRPGPLGADAASPASNVPTRDATPDDPRLAAALRRVRTLAYGWPGGVLPKGQP
jgi:hypothetical protein